MSHLDNSDFFHLASPVELAGENCESFDKDMKCEMRSFKNNFYIFSHQETPASKKTLDIDTDLRKYFGFGKRQFKNIVKKPGNKLGFKLSNYIHIGDSPEAVNDILGEIAAHIEFTKASPVKAIFHPSFFGTRGPQCIFPCLARPPPPGPAIPASSGPDARPAAAMARPAIGAGRGTATAATSMNMHATMHS